MDHGSLCLYRLPKLWRTILFFIIQLNDPTTDFMFAIIFEFSWTFIHAKCHSFLTAHTVCKVIMLTPQIWLPLTWLITDKKKDMPVYLFAPVCPGRILGHQFQIRNIHIRLWSHIHVKVPYEPRKTIFAKLSGSWLSRGSYGIYVAVTGSIALRITLQLRLRVSPHFGEPSRHIVFTWRKLVEFYPQSEESYVTW